MTQKVDAIYENGVLRPLSRLDGIAERSKVRLTVESEPDESHPISDCIGIMPDEDAAELSRIIEAEFEKVNPSEWR